MGHIRIANTRHGIQSLVLTGWNGIPRDGQDLDSAFGGLAD